MTWLSNEELAQFGAVGRGVRVSRDAMVLGAKNVRLGDNVRIDAGVKILASKGWIDVASHVHVACNVILAAGGGISLRKFSMVGMGSMLISASDDVASGDYLVGPMFDPDLINVKARPIRLNYLSVLCAGCIVLPGVTLDDGSVAGAGSLVTETTKAWGLYVGQPARWIKPRRQACILLADEWERRWKTLD